MDEEDYVESDYVGYFYEKPLSPFAKELKQKVISYIKPDGDSYDPGSPISLLKMEGINSSKELNDYLTDNDGDWPMDNIDLFEDIFALCDVIPGLNEADIMDFGEDYLLNNDWDQLN